MFDFHFVYSNGTTYDVKNVEKIVIVKSDKAKIVTGDDILTETLPLKTMCLYSANGNITVSGENLIVIDVLKEEV